MQRTDDQSYRFLHERAHALYRALQTQERWERTLAAAGPSLSLCVHWTDQTGNDRRVVLDRALLAAHRTIIRSLIDDLQALGPAGEDAVAHLVSGHAAGLTELHRRDHIESRERRGN